MHACRPTSRGSITVASADPLAAPLISPNYLSTEKDLQEALAGARLLRALAATDPLRAAIAAEVLPGVGMTSDAELLADFRARIQANNETLAKESERFSTWLIQKQHEEKSIADAVSYFVSENPITVSGAAAAPPAGAKTPAT